MPDAPLPNSYWVIPDKLLAGDYPGSKFDENQAHLRISHLLEAGINFIVDLTREAELPSYLPVLQEEAGWRQIKIVHQRMPIHDLTALSFTEMTEVLDLIDSALAGGKIVYVHCQAGLGRTGSVVGCFLARHGKPGDEALAEIRRLRQNVHNSYFDSPENDEQRQLIRHWRIGQ
jgi:protein-tyrosine phosphatase